MFLRFETTPQKHLNNRKLLQPRGRCVGGSSTANLMLYVRGNSGDYNRWADLIGHDRFKYENVLPYFKKSQNAIGYGEGMVVQLSSAKSFYFSLLAPNLDTIIKMNIMAAGDIFQHLRLIYRNTLLVKNFIKHLSKESLSTYFIILL